MWLLTKNTIDYNLMFRITGTIFQMLLAVFICEMGTKYYKRTIPKRYDAPTFLVLGYYRRYGL